MYNNIIHTAFLQFLNICKILLLVLLDSVIEILRFESVIGPFIFKGDILILIFYACLKIGCRGFRLAFVF